jgi:hypothetical protein
MILFSMLLVYTRAGRPSHYTGEVRNWAILAILCAAVAAGQGAYQGSTAEPRFRATEWGMTQAEVVASETKKPSASFQTDHESVVLYDSVPFAGFPGQLLYFFAGGRLVRAKHVFEIPQGDPNQSIGDYNAVDTALRSIYGKPFDTKNIWSEDAGQEELLNYLEQDRATPADLLVSDLFLGEAIERGHLKLYSVWLGKRTRIVHGMAGEKGVITHQIEYRP